MKKLPDVSVNIPLELLSGLATVIEVGLQRTKLLPSVKNNLSAWWRVEYELIQSDLDEREKMFAAVVATLAKNNKSPKTK